MESWSQVLYNASAANIQAIHLLNTGGYIREEKTITRPMVVLRATNPDLIHALVVNEMTSPKGDSLEISFQTDKAINSEYILDILVPTNSIQIVDTHNGGNAVIFPNALTNDKSKDIFLTSTGTSTLFVESTSIEAYRFLAESLGSGFVQVNSDSINADVIDLASGGSGNIALLTGTATANQFITLAAGSGNIIVKSYNNTPITTNALVSKAIADGNVAFLTGGSCNSSYVESSGVGASYLNLMKCQDTAAVLHSTGDIYVSAASSFASDDTGAGTIYAQLEATTLTTGIFSPLTTVSMPEYSSLIVPDNSPITISLEGTAMPTTRLPSGVPSRTTLPAMNHLNKDRNNLGPGGLAGIVFGIVFVLFAIVYLVIRRRQLKRARQPTKLEFVADVEYTDASTPVGSPPEPQVLSM